MINTTYSSAFRFQGPLRFAGGLTPEDEKWYSQLATRLSKKLEAEESELQQFNQAPQPYIKKALGFPVPDKAVIFIRDKLLEQQGASSKSHIPPVDRYHQTQASVDMALAERVQKIDQEKEIKSQELAAKKKKDQQSKWSQRTEAERLKKLNDNKKKITYTLKANQELLQNSLSSSYRYYQPTSPLSLYPPKTKEAISSDSLPLTSRPSSSMDAFWKLLKLKLLNF
jgi:hypothetical protein